LRTLSIALGNRQSNRTVSGDQLTRFGVNLVLRNAFAQIRPDDIGNAEKSSTRQRTSVQQVRTLQSSV